MSRYLQVAKISWQNALIYKANFIGTSIMNIFRVIAEAAFWAVFFEVSKKDSIGGYTLFSIITYYLLMFIIGTFINANQTGFSIANDIKTGRLSQFLVKPVNYLGYYMSEAISKKLLQLSITLLIFIPVFAICYKNLVFNIVPVQLIFYPLVLSLAFILNYLINVAFSLTAFFVIEITSFFFLQEIIFNFLSGGVFPLDILPKSILGVFRLLPFMYVTYFPISILNKGISTSELFYGIAAQCIWIIVLYIIIKILWRFGIRLYAGTGI